VFHPVDALGLAGALRGARRLWAQPAIWAAMQRAGMQADLGWSGPAQEYAGLYQRLMR
jgi:starch synthase